MKFQKNYYTSENPYCCSTTYKKIQLGQLKRKPAKRGRRAVFFFFYGRRLSLFIYFSSYHNCNISTGVYNIESEILNAFIVKSYISVIVPKSIRLNNSFGGLLWFQQFQDSLERLNNSSRILLIQQCKVYSVFSKFP